MTETPGDTTTLGNPSDTASPTRISLESGVNVSKAENEFSQLARRLSQHGSPKSDVEKAEHSENVFNLREYLTSSNDANQEAGLKHKVCRVNSSRITIDPHLACRGPMGFHVCLGDRRNW